MPRAGGAPAVAGVVLALFALALVAQQGRRPGTHVTETPGAAAQLPVPLAMRRPPPSTTGTPPGTPGSTGTPSVTAPSSASHTAAATGSGTASPSAAATAIASLSAAATGSPSPSLPPSGSPSPAAASASGSSTPPSASASAAAGAAVSPGPCDLSVAAGPSGEWALTVTPRLPSAAGCGSVSLVLAGPDGQRFVAALPAARAGSCGATVVYLPSTAPAGAYTVSASAPVCTSWAPAPAASVQLTGAPPSAASAAAAAAAAAAIVRLTGGPSWGGAAAGGVEPPPASADARPQLAIPAHSPARFAIVPGALGRPPPSTVAWDLWRVDVAGVPTATQPGGATVRAAGEVAMAPAPRGAGGAAAPALAYANGSSYMFELALPDDAAATGVTDFLLEAYLQQVDYSVPGARSASCATTRDPGTLHVSARLRLVPGVAAWDEAEAPPTTDAAAPRGPSAAHASALFRGGYVVVPDATPAPSPYASSPRLRWRAAPPAALPASGRRPAFHYFTPAEARECVRGKWLAFIGDSTMEEVALTTLLLTGAAYDEGWGGPFCGMLGFKTARIFDSDTPPLSPLLRGNGTGAGARFTMYWAGSADPCDNLEGAAAFAQPDFTARLRAAHAPDGGGPGGSRRYPIVIFNTGLHDLGSRTFSPLEYAALLAGPVASNLSAIAGPGAPVILKTTNPKTGPYACQGHATQFNVGEAAVQALNALAPAALAAGGLASVPFDEHALLAPLHEEAEVTQHHCAHSLLRWLPRALGPVVRDGCLAAGHAVLNLVCPRWEEGGGGGGSGGSTA